MARRREQRNIDKRKRRALRKAAVARRMLRTSAERRVRVADDMLDQETFERVGYDPARVPSALAWLDLPEEERVARVEAYHLLLPRSQQPPNVTLHATLHVAVETQLAMDDPVEARPAMARLAADGLDRHDALHAVAAKLSRRMYDAMKGADFDVDGYRRDLAELTLARWLEANLEDGGEGPEGA